MGVRKASVSPLFLRVSKKAKWTKNLSLDFLQEIKRAAYNLLYAYGKAVNHKDKPLCIIQYEIDKLGFIYFKSKREFS